MSKSVLEDWADCDRTDTLFIIVCTCICWTIVPTVRTPGGPRYLTDLTVTHPTIDGRVQY